MVCTLQIFVSWFLLFPVRVIMADLEVFQAEAGLLSDVTIKRDRAGYQGSGFGDYSDLGGGSIAWTYNVALAGDVELSLRYATRNNRPLDLYVDDVKRLQFKCAQTGSWSTWRVESVVIFLAQGRHVLRLQAPFSGPNVDFLSVSSSSTPPPVAAASPTKAPVANNSSPTTVIYQAEVTSSSNKIIIGATHAGYEGQGYADFADRGGYLLWAIEFPTTASYDIRAKYAAESGRKCNLYIDGYLKGTFAFAGTGAWDSWKFETITVSLSQGVHEVMILAEESTGPNLDWISVTSTLVLPFPTRSPVMSTPKPASPVEQPTTGPVVQPTAAPVAQPTSPVVVRPSIFPSQVVLGSNSRMDKGQFVFSSKYAIADATRRSIATSQKFVSATNVKGMESLKWV
jgi:Carbohydrate binding module (family 6)/DUF5010 C-terminal domain